MRWSRLPVISCGVGCALLYEMLFCHQGLMTYLKLLSTDDQTNLVILLVETVLMTKTVPRCPLECT